jgi:hypothetical protein
LFMTNFNGIGFVIIRSTEVRGTLGMTLVS